MGKEKRVIGESTFEAELIKPDPKDSRVLTKQAEDDIYNAVKKGAFGIQAMVPQSEYDALGIEKQIHVLVTVKPQKIIIPLQGDSYYIIPGEDGAEGMINRIHFNTFQLEKYLDSKAQVAPVVETKKKASYALLLTGSGIEFDIKLNGKILDLNFSGKKVGGLSGFSFNIPINKYLKIGKNTLEIVPSKKAQEYKVQLETVDMNQKNASVGKQSLRAGAPIEFFTLPNSVELEKQISVFDKN